MDYQNVDFRQWIRHRIAEIDRTLASVETIKIERERLAELLNLYESQGNTQIWDSLHQLTTAFSNMSEHYANGHADAKTRGKAQDPNSATSRFVFAFRRALEALGRKKAQFNEVYSVMSEDDKNLFDGKFREQSARKALARAGARAGLEVERGGAVRIIEKEKATLS